jgi:hypothetical protein
MDGDYNLIAEELILRAAKQERRLLSREAEAEAELKRAVERLAPAEKRLRRAQDEAERRARAVARAESALLACQAARAAGPHVEPAPSETPPPVVEDGPVSPPQRPRRQPRGRIPKDPEAPSEQPQ